MQAFLIGPSAVANRETGSGRPPPQDTNTTKAKMLKNRPMPVRLLLYLVLHLFWQLLLLLLFMPEMQAWGNSRSRICPA